MRRLFVFLVLVTTAIQVHAQPESSGLLEALRVVPIQTFLSDADGTVTYSDVAAAFSARDMAVPRDWPSFQAQGNMFGVFAVLPPAFPDAITEWLTLAGEYPDTHWASISSISPGLSSSALHRPRRSYCWANSLPSRLLPALLPATTGHQIWATRASCFVR